MGNMRSNISNLIFTIIIGSIYAHDIVIRIHDGKISGEILKDYDGNNYFSFQSIPFAKPPIGSAPIENDRWNGILDGSKVAPVCPQFKGQQLVGREDCLYLNVYSPTNKGKLPVMFFIHGGLFRDGSGNGINFGPQFLMPKNIVLVTINYRLGYLGGLSFKNQSMGIPGNAHMKDQVMALKWVQKNIMKFGGDPNMVTIFGQSVGGGSVNMLMLSPMSKGLFHRAISQSGYALTPWLEGYLGTGKVLASKLGIERDSDEEIINELQNISMEEILDKQDKNIIIPVNARYDFMPVVEGQTNEPAYLPMLPIDIITSGEFMKVPYILGYNDQECLVLHATSENDFGIPFCPAIKEYIPFDVDTKSNQDVEDIVQDIRKAFLKNNETEDVSLCTELCNGSWFTAAFYRTLVLMMEKSNQPIYAYRFSADSGLNIYKFMNAFTAHFKGADHCDELGYLFTSPNTPKIRKGSIEERLMRSMVKLWTDFAKTGKVIKRWLPVEKCKLNYLDIANVLTSKVNPDPELIDFWSNIYTKYNGDKNLCQI